MRPLIFALLVAACAGNVNAQAVRPKIPADAVQGKITATTASAVEIDGKVYRLAAGARILNQRNLSVTPNMVAPGSQARYVLDAGGHVRGIWLVDDAPERARTGPVERTPGSSR